MNARTVLLYGESLLLSCVATGLAEVPGLQVERARTWEEASHLLAQGTPHVVVFDLTDPCESHVLPLLLRKPQPMLLGLDTERNQAVLISGQSACSLTLSQVVTLVEEGAGRTSSLTF